MTIIQYKLKNKGNLLGLLPLIIFLCLYISIGIFTKDFNKMPLLIGILIACGFAIIIRSTNKDMDFNKSINEFCTGAANNTLILLVFIFILAGAFYSLAKNIGAIETVVNLGLYLLPKNLILPGLFIIGTLLSFSMGTSMGTITALMPIGVSIANKTGINIALVSGIIVGASMFGDNLSFISDTTIASTRTQNVSIKEKFITNLLIIIPAYIINVILLFFQNVNINDNLNISDIDLVNLLPYLAIIILSILGFHIIKVMSFGIILSVIIGIFHGNFTFIESFSIIHIGMKSMEDMAIIAIFVGGLVYLMGKLGGIDFLLYHLSKNTKTKKGAYLSIALLVSLIDLATTSNSIAIITAGPIATDITKEFKLNKRIVASILDIYSCSMNGIMPYAGQLLVASGIAKISGISIVKFAWYPFLMVIVTTIYILFMKGKNENNNITK